ncbi:hypothetical protein [Martelella alba]|uniref:Uncharacterized protein n=1 Tax=Martelella alba TaxID=2590451 RepID=A0ABY2SDA7_9HYPH|nr:hypothetical protein [Martelella alba]TKI02321.1 hypothetical protein FCN80_25370 [Martelella alba]
MKNIIVLMICLIPFLSFANPEDSVGYWSVNCGGFGGSVEVKPSHEARVNVNDNNLYISGGIVEDNNGKLKLFYRDVIESMNETIDWSDISQSEPIAEMSIENGTLHMTWKGFFDNKQKIYIWKSEPDFVVASEGSANVKMKKCDFK